MTAKPCPFCNVSNPDVEEFAQCRRYWFSAICHGCGARGPEATTKERAIELWNERALTKQDIERNTIARVIKGWLDELD